MENFDLGLLPRGWSITKLVFSQENLYALTESSELGGTVLKGTLGEIREFLLNYWLNRQEEAKRTLEEATLRLKDRYA